MQRIVNLNCLSFILCLCLSLCVGFELLIVKQNSGSFVILITADLDKLLLLLFSVTKKKGRQLLDMTNKLRNQRQECS